MKFFAEKRAEVMQHIEAFMLDKLNDYLTPIEKIWQPSDFLPDSSKDNFIESLKELQYCAKDISYDLMVVLVGDTITEEALPTYESWLMMVNGVSKNPQSGWMKWTRAWTAEENRHGDLLNKYLYLSGRINMKQFEISTQYLLADGFDIGTAYDPYRSFVYTSFQETATAISHRSVASIAKKQGDKLLAKMCGVIASDEMRHAKAYKDFVKKILEVDPNEMIIAFEDMMRKKIVMPAHFLRELGQHIGQSFAPFSEAAQRIGVYTVQDYVHIAKELVEYWNLEKISSLNSVAEKSREYLCKLPERLLKIADRMPTPSLNNKFSWVY